MECQGEETLLQQSRPYVAMILIQLGYAGFTILAKVSLNTGMSHYVLVVYRHAFATVAIAPFAIIFERKVRPKMTFRVFMQIFVLALLGPVIDQNFFYAGLKFTSPTFSCALTNILPAMTFVLAVLCRMEKVDIKKVRCQAKIVGTLVTVGGAMLMTLYKGPVMELLWSKHNHTHGSNIANEVADKDWLKGSIFVLIATLAWATLFILQATTLKTYPAHLSLTALICFLGTLQACAVTIVMEHKLSVWSIGWDMNLLSSAYAGIMASSIAYYVQGLVMKKRGPVFVTAFSPLNMVLVAIMGSFILAEKIYLGGILGALLIVAGLYSVLWGKYKEYQAISSESPKPEVNKCAKDNNIDVCTSLEENDDVEMQKVEDKRASS